MTITTDTTKKGRISVYADGEYRFTVSAFIWAASSLYEGCEADEETLEVLRGQGQTYDAEEAAVRLLSYRAHSEKELKMKLRRKSPADVAEAAAAKMRGLGDLNDEKFASQLAEELFRTKHYAPQRILSELFSRGIAKEFAENAVSALDIDENKGIIELISKMRLPEEPTEKDVARLMRRLLSAGYSYSEIRRALAEWRED